MVLGKFKRNERCCTSCGMPFLVPEEKRTDVNIAIHLVEEAYRDSFDTALLISGDTDLVPAISMVFSAFPAKKIGIIAPYKRYNGEIAEAGTFSRKIQGMILCPVSSRIR